ncbi:hypothetical protein D3C71_37350 [compost metagenome]
MIRPPPLFFYQKGNWVEYNNYKKNNEKIYINNDELFLFVIELCASRDKYR